MKRIRGTSSRDVLIGTNEDELIEGLAGNDDLYGGGGNDIIHGGSGRDVLDGGAGDDELWFDWNDRSVDGGSGIDLARADFRGTGQDLRFSVSDNLVGSVLVGSTSARGIERLNILSGSGDDVWHGGAHADFISGGAGDDTLFGEGGDDTLLGDSGNDELYGGVGDDDLEGGGGNDRLYAGSGHDILSGAAGDDELNAGPDRNSLDGGSGNDLAVIDRSAAAFAIQFSLDNPATQQTLDNGTTVVNVERVNLRTGAGADRLLGGRFADFLSGGDGNDRIVGGDGDDELHGEGGNDLMYGGDGRDTLFGGAGDDFLNSARGDRLVDGGFGSDWAQFDFEDSVQNLFFAVAGNLAGTVVVDGTQIHSIEQIHFLGGRGNDTVIGGNLDDVMYGRRGQDVLRGEDGVDVLEGDEGDDRLFGGAGNDILRGGSGIDELTGGAGNDTLDGGAGNDRAIYSGRLQDYVADRMADGSIRIADMRAGAPDGVDVVSNVELFSFADALLTPAQLLQALSNRAPVAAIDAVTLGEDDGLNLLNVLANDRDPNTGDAISIANVVTTGLRGQVTLAPDGKLYYAANGAFEELGVGQTATESFSYTIRDRAGLTSTATVTVTIQGSNDAPVALADVATASAAGNTVISPLANDFDPDTGDVLTLASLSFAGTIGTAWFGANNTVIYTPGAAFRSLGEGQTATDTFYYSVNDGHPGTGNLVSTAAVTGVVIGVNDGPTATDDQYAVAHTGAVVLGNLLANDFDVDLGDTIATVPVEAVSTRGAHFSIDAQGNVEYDPGDIFADLAPGETTTDSFSYTVVDSHGATSTATVNLTVNADGIVLDPRLRVVADSIFEGDTSENLFDLLAERAEGFGRIVSIGAPTKGAVTYDLATHSVRFAADTSDLDYLAHGDMVAHPTFNYTVQDASGELHVGEVRMSVQGIDDPATAADDAIALQAGKEIRLYDLLVANDDPDSRLIDIVSVDTAGMLGRIIPDSRDTLFSYAADTPELMALAPGETIVDHFTYTIRDRITDNGPVTTATVTVTVTGVAHASPMTSALMAYGVEEAPMPNALQAYAAQTHMPDALMAYAQEGQHAFAETGFQDSPLHDAADLFARSMSHFWAGHMDLAM